jgi:hypothetical protein
MSNDEKKYIPFTNTDELRFHMDASQMLMETIKNDIDLMAFANEDHRAELEESVTDGLHVLMDGFATVIQSIQQGYVK